MDRVIARVAKEFLAPRTPVDRMIPAAAKNDILTKFGREFITLARTDKNVVVVIADHRRAAIAGLARIDIQHKSAQRRDVLDVAGLINRIGSEATDDRRSTKE